MVDEVFESFLGLEAVVPVFQVDVIGFELVAAADGGPEVFVFGGFFGPNSVDPVQGFSEAFKSPQIGRGDAQEGQGFEESAFVHNYKSRKFYVL